MIPPVIPRLDPEAESVCDVDDAAVAPIDDEGP